MSDFCFSWPMMNRVLQQADLMDQMMLCLGVVPARAARMDKGMAFYEARSRCIACLDDRRCRDWIARRQGMRAPSAPEFCDNAEFFRRAKQETFLKQMEERHEATSGKMDTAVAPRDVQRPDAERT